VLAKLKEELGVICKKAAIKANVKNSAVLSSKQISDLAKFAPQTLDELSDLKITDKFGIANEIFSTIAMYLPVGS
jgi:ribonuclease D